MKKSMRALALLLVLCMLLAGCGQAQPAASSQGGEESQAAEPAQTAEEGGMSEELESELAGLSGDVIDPDLTCTITLGNWPADTAPTSELALFEGYRATMARQYPNVTLVPDYFSYTLSNYVPMAKGGTAPSIFQPPFTDPQLLISQGLVGDVTDALQACGALDKFSPSYMEMLSDENGRVLSFCGSPDNGSVILGKYAPDERLKPFFLFFRRDLLGNAHLLGEGEQYNVASCQ